MLVYDIEKFVIDQMFRPYQDILVENPEDYKKCELMLRKRPEEIISILFNNKKAHNLVFNRLSKMDIKFYKWLEHPIIHFVNGEITTTRRMNENENK